MHFLQPGGKNLYSIVVTLTSFYQLASTVEAELCQLKSFRSFMPDHEVPSIQIKWSSLKWFPSSLKKSAVIFSVPFTKPAESVTGQEATPLLTKGKALSVQSPQCMAVARLLLTSLALDRVLL